jgi:ABC-type dipeptide/oligopeptide/nickel transport system permease component
MKFLVGVLEGTAEHTFSVYNAVAEKFIFLLDVPRFLLALLKLAFCFLPGILICHYSMHNSSGHLSTFWLIVGCSLKLATAWLIVRAFRNSMMKQRRRRRRYYLAVSPANMQSRSASRRKSRAVPQMAQ